RSTFTATARRPPSVATAARCTCAIEAAATGGPNEANSSPTGLPNAASTARSASTCANGAILSCSVSRSRAKPTPTTSGRVARHWPSFTELGRGRGGGAARRLAATRLARRSISRARRTAARAGGGSSVVSMPAKTPSRAHTKPAWPRRTRWATAWITAVRCAGGEQSQPPARGQRGEASAHALKRHPGQARPPHHLRKGIGSREAADRFDEIAVGVRVLGDGAAERGNHVEGIEIIERGKARYVDGGEFEAVEASADAQHAMGFAERCRDARHVADAEGDGD